MTDKQITTLVPDIYDLLQSKTPLTEEQAQEIGDTITETLKTQLAREPTKRRGISMSSFGEKCLRKLWYREHFPEKAEALPPHTRLKFLYGHIIEALVLGFAKAAGHKVVGEQTKMKYAGVEGSRDAVVDGVTVDVKSANSRSFEKFKKHELQSNDPFNYLDQISLYTLAAADDEQVTVKKTAAFIAVDQELGHIALDSYRISDKNYEAIAAEKISAVANKEVLPKRGYAPVPDGVSGNEALCLNCRYCDFKEDCWSDTNDGRGLIKILFSNGPRWFTRIVKDPKPRVVQEV
jgi:hypothetical protein